MCNKIEKMKEINKYLQSINIRLCALVVKIKTLTLA